MQNCLANWSKHCCREGVCGSAHVLECRILKNSEQCAREVCFGEARMGRRQAGGDPPFRSVGRGDARFVGGMREGNEQCSHLATG